MAKSTDIGEAGLQGWRAAVGGAVAEPLAKRTPFGEDQIRAVVGATFFALSVMYVVKTVGQAAKQMRD